MATTDFDYKTCQKQLKDTIRLIQDTVLDMLRSTSQHIEFEHMVKSAEIVRMYKDLMQLVQDMRTQVICDFPFPPPKNDIDADTKLKALRDEIAMLVYEFEIPIL